MDIVASLVALVASVIAYPLPPPAPMPLVPNTAVEIPVDANNSLNWAGYVAGDGTYTAVYGTWTVPAIVPSDAAQADATWVGIGGEQTRDLIQIGTQAITRDGSVEYEAWYELLPAASEHVPLRIQRGDSVTGSVAYVGDSIWVIRLINNTTGHSFEKYVRYESSFSSADWIQEMPMGVNEAGRLSFIPLDDFGSVRFTGAGAVKNGREVSLDETGASPIRLGRGRNALAIPTTIQGGEFSVIRTDTHPSVVLRNRPSVSRAPIGAGELTPRDLQAQINALLEQQFAR